jgi:hypothetical protein
MYKNVLTVLTTNIYILLYVIYVAKYTIWAFHTLSGQYIKCPSYIDIDNG